MRHLTKEQERETMRELQEKRQTEERPDPEWARDFWQGSNDSDNDRVRRQLGFGFREGWDL